MGAGRHDGEGHLGDVLGGRHEMVADGVSLQLVWSEEGRDVKSLLQ